MTPAQYNEYQRQADVIEQAKKHKEEQESKQMTSVEWLMNELKKERIIRDDLKTTIALLTNEAKEMHKQEIIKANRDGVDMAVDKKPFIMGEQYYQETFVSKGSDAKDVVLGYKTSENFYYGTDEFGTYRKIYYKDKEQTLYTEEQVREAIRMARREIGYGSNYEFREDVIIQSLKPKKD
jgi:hypothetical protein